MKQQKVRRLVAMLLVLLMAAGLFPISALADNSVVIYDQAGLERIQEDLTGHYKLAGDIELTGAWTPLGGASTPFVGTFDGGGHTISRLSIESAGTYLGLFGRIGAGGKVENVTVEGSILTSSTAAASNVGGIAGQNQGLISGCANRATIVSGGNNVGGIAGDHRGTASAYAQIKGCANLAEVKGNKYVGGIAGQSQYGNFQNCYNISDIVITAKSSLNSGGIVGQTGGGGSILNCYNTGNICIDDSASTSNVGRLVGFLNGALEVENCYWLGDQEVKGIGGGTGGQSAVSHQSNEEMTAQGQDGFAALLGRGYIDDVNGVNGGYPILTWQDRREQHEVFFRITPSDASVAVNGIEVGHEGVLLLPDGTYQYQAEKFGYLSQTGAFTVAGGPPEVVEVRLQEVVRQPVTFQVSPEQGQFQPGDPKITVTHQKEGVQAQETDGRFLLYPGDYEYVITARGYRAVRVGNFQVKSAPLQIPQLIMQTQGAWDGESISEPINIQGICQIGSGEELAWLMAEINKGQLILDAVLTDDIDLGGHKWTPGGAYNKQYAGHFDGQGYSIEGLYIEGGGSLGLFGYLSPQGLIENVSISGKITGSANIGGIVGASYGTIRNCGSDVDIEASDQRIGGIVGVLYDGSIEGCVNTGEVSSTFNSISLADTPAQLGGIAGSCAGKITASYNAGTVSSAQKKWGGVGGLAGTVAASGSLTNAYNTGNINCTTASADVGAVVGQSAAGISAIDKVYYLDHAFPVGIGSGAGNAEGKTAEEMRADQFVLALGNQAFNKAENEGQNNGFPVLKWQGGTSANTNQAEELVANDKAALTLEVDQIHQAGSLILPRRGQSTETTITWHSSHPDVIADDGTVTLPTTGKTIVTLTATISAWNNTTNDTKEFRITVYSTQLADQEELERALAKLKEVQHPLWGTDVNVVAMIEAQLKEEGFSGITVALTDPGVNSIEADPAVYIKGNGDLAYFYTNLEETVIQRAAQVRDVTFVLQKREVVKPYQAVFVIPWDGARVAQTMQEEIADQITWDLIKGNNLDQEEVISTLFLPVQVNQKRFVTIAWTASNPSAVQIEKKGTGLDDADQGKIYRTEEPVEVTLTATIRFNHTGISEPDIVVKKEIVIKIAGGGTDIRPQMQAELDRKYTPDKLKDSLSGAPINVDQVSGDIQLLSPRNTGVEHYDDYRFTVESTTPDVLEVNGYRVYVYRPLPGQEPVNGALTVTMTHKATGLSVSKDFSFTVLPLSQEEIEEAIALMDAVSQGYFDGIKGENTQADQIKENLSPFRQAVFADDHRTLIYSRKISDDTGRGIRVDDLPGSEPGGPGYEQWRLFRSSRPDLISHEMLRVTQRDYDATVTVNSCLTHDILGKYAKKFSDTAGYEIFEGLYQHPVSATMTVKGSVGGTDPNPGTGKDGHLVMSFEWYDPEDGMTAFLLPAPVKIPFSAGEKGKVLAERALGEENAILLSGSFIKSITIDEITYEGDFSENLSWSVYKNNAEDSVGLGDYVPADGDVYRVVLTTYDASYRFPVMKIDMDALYWTVADLLESGMSSQTVEAAIVAMQSGASQEEINEFNTALSQAGDVHRIIIDGRTIAVNTATNPYTYTKTLAADRLSARAGETVNVQVTPAAGMVLVEGSLKANGTVLHQGDQPGSYVLVMPDAHVVLLAEFQEAEKEANMLFSAVFSLDEAGLQQVLLTPAFHQTETEYQLSVYDYQLRDGLYSTVTFSEPAKAQFYYLMDYYGMVFPTPGPKLVSGQPYGHKQANLFFGNELRHYITITPEEGPAKNYHFQMTLLPTLSELDLFSGKPDAEVQWKTDFQPDVFTYTVVVPDEVTEIKVAPQAFDEDNEVEIAGQVFSGLPVTIALDGEGKAFIELTVTDGYDVSSVYQVMVETKSTEEEQLKAKLEALDALMENIAATYRANSSEWVIMDMAAYKMYHPGTIHVTDADTVQNYIDLAITSVADSYVTDISLAKSAIILRSLGIDPQRLFTTNKTHIDVVRKLKEKEAGSIYNAAFILLAYQQDDGHYGAEKGKIQSLIGQIKEAKHKGALDDADTAGMILPVLAFYYYAETDDYGVQAEVREIVDETMTKLSQMQGRDGSYGDANKDAMMILGLSAFGVNCDHDQRFTKEGKSLLDGLLSYQNAAKDGFLYQGNENALATEQGFRALIAAAKVMKTGEKHNIYDFRSLESHPAYAKSVGNEEKPPIPESKNKISVSFTLKGDIVHGEGKHTGSYPTWIQRTTVTIPDDATAYHVIDQVLTEKGFNYDQSGAQKGYLRWVEGPSGERLSEFDNGPNSGWMYRVNDELVDSPITKYIVSKGDRIVLFYTDDWEKEKGAVNMGGTGLSGADKDKTVTAVVNLTATVNKDGKAEATLKGDTLKSFVEAIKSGKDKKNALAQVNLSVPTSAHTLQFVLPADVVKALAAAKETAFCLRTDLGTMTFDAKGISEMVSSAGSLDWTIQMTKVDGAGLSAENAILVDGHPVFDLSVLVGGKAITTFGKGTLSVVLPYQMRAGEIAGQLNVYHINAAGVAEKVKDANYDAQKQGMMFTTDHLSLYAITYSGLTAEFDDVPQQHWAYEQIRYLARRGFVTGMTETTYAPNNQITRAEFAAILFRMSQEAYVSSGETFDDVKSGAWYETAVTWAKEKAIVQGASPHLFSPNALISREDMAVMAARYIAAQGHELKNGKEAELFEDDHQISAYARGSVYQMQSNDILTGKGNHTFAPSAHATRAEAAVILARLQQQMESY